MEEIGCFEVEVLLSFFGGIGEFGDFDFVGVFFFVVDLLLIVVFY